jgi:hypothetical protein
LSLSPSSRVVIVITKISGGALQGLPWRDSGE